MSVLPVSRFRTSRMSLQKKTEAWIKSRRFCRHGGTCLAWKELSELKELELVGSLSYNIEINAAGVNKGTALVALGEMLGIPRESIMACGDGDNDVHLLREVGFGVAMANAQPQVKEAADYITASNDEDGVARAIESLPLHR